MRRGMVIDSGRCSPSSRWGAAETIVHRFSYLRLVYGNDEPGGFFWWLFSARRARSFFFRLSIFLIRQTTS